ncbi:class II peroxidase [Sphaerobolus stellatus SS14]|uniref:Class II peroxidase n=1 Tax=Sphaerobolus stellatus (strain SS14) TaxID=990650 RepID=A0A0C9V9K8_SPHS4|nr:class II peroxidase [Sphaerobolus stellatus SS14]
MRLQSDFALARDPRTACVWQSFINEQELMQNAFVEAIDKMSRIGLAHPEKLVDCSIVVPQPAAKVTKPEARHVPGDEIFQRCSTGLLRCSLPKSRYRSGCH